jgi:hypothetical protein
MFQLLRRVLLWRCRRAQSRLFGLTALTELYNSLQSSQAKRSVVLFLRPALRGVVERETVAESAAGSAAVGVGFGAGSAAKASDRPWTLRHHYMAHLEGSGSTVRDQVRAV